MSCDTDTYDLCINQGSTYARIILWLQGSPCGSAPVGGGANPVDLTGYTATLQIRAFPLAPTVLYDATSDIILGGIEGTITLTIPASASENFTWWQGVYDLLLTSAGGQVTRLLQGAVSVAPVVTNPSGSPATPGTGGAAGLYLPTFQAGYLQYCGPNNVFAANINFIVGLAIPNPSGVLAPCLLLGSGVPQAWLITDQAADNVTPGINLGIAAGETQGAGVEDGGLLELYGGGSFGGTGGPATLQGGTSFNGPGGPTTIAGGNSTNGIPGDLFLIGGQAGTQGASVHLIATIINGISGVIRHRFNSNILMDEYLDGSWFLYNGNGFGLVGQSLVSGGPGAPVSWQTGYTGTIATAKLTGGGTNGSMTFASGILISQIPAT